MSFHYRPWTQGDDLALRQIWADASNHQQAVDRALLQAERSGRDGFARGIVVEEDGVPVAAGSLALSTREPARVWAYVEVAPAVRGQGIATHILERLRAQLDEAFEASQVPTRQIKARYAVHPGTENPLDPAAGALCASLGLRRINASRAVLVSPGAVPMPDFEDSSAGTRHVSDIATGSVELARFVHEFYVRSHASWDPTEMSLGGVASMLLSPESGAHGALVVRQGPPLGEDAQEGTKPGRIRAFALSYAQETISGEATGEPQALDSGASADHRAADVLLGYDFSETEDQQIRALADLLGVMVPQYPVQIEVDDSLPALERVVRALVADGTAKVMHESLVLATDGSPQKPDAPRES